MVYIMAVLVCVMVNVPLWLVQPGGFSFFFCENRRRFQ